MTIFYITSVLTCMFTLAGALFISYIAAHMEGPEEEKIINKEPKYVPGIIYTHNYASDIVDNVLNTFGDYGLLNDSYYDSESGEDINAFNEAYDESLTMVETMVNEVYSHSTKGALVRSYKYSESGKRYEEFESKND